MAWIESHDGLGEHIKTRRLATALNVSLPTAVGHLQFLWWTALKYAEDGCLSNLTNEDIAYYSKWDGEPDVLVYALVNAKFLDSVDGVYWLHDWNDYAGRLIEQREKNRERSKQAREKERAKSVSEPYANSTRTVSERGANGAKSVSEPCRATVPNLTVPNPTQPNRTEQDTTTTTTEDAEDTDASVGEVAAAVVHSEPVPYVKIQDLFNATCTRLAKIKAIDGERRKAVSARFKTYGFVGFKTLCEKANASDFLCGGGGKNFVASFDWLVKPTNFAKVVEGNYDNRTEPPPSQYRPPGSNGQPSAIDRIIAEERAKTVAGGEPSDVT